MNRRVQPEQGSPEPVFFIDRSLGRRQVAQALLEAGAKVLLHDDLFGQHTSDVDWLQEAGTQGWIVLTKDSAIRRNPHERQMVQDARVRMFALTQKGLTGEQMAALFAEALPGMRKRIAKTQAPFVFSILRGGEIRREL